MKWCKSEGVKDKLNPHSYIFIGLPRMVKQCKSSGVICLLPPHSYTILPPLADQCNPKRCKSFELHFPKKSSHCSPTLTFFYPSWQFNSYLILSPLDKTNYPLTLTPIYPPWQPTLTSIYPLWTNYPLTLTPLYPPWQTNSYINLPPLNKLPPHSYTILPPLAAQLLHEFTPSEQITPSLLHHFTPLGSPTLTSFYPLWTNYPLTLTPFYHPWQPNSYIILPPSGQITPSLLHLFTPLGSPTLTSIYPL